HKELHFPHSLGLLYSAFTYYTGFKVNSGEYKLMGLAPYGQPKYADLILDHLIDLKEDGTFRLDLDYFDYCTGLTMTNLKFADLFGASVRDWKKDLLTPFHMDIAASIQQVTEGVMLRLARSLGARSVLGDPRSPSMQKTLNLRVKYRESFRPFAPAVLREDVADWFELGADSPYMLLVADVKRERRRRMTNEEEAMFGIDKLNVARSEIPAVTHVDYSARVQTVHSDTNPRFHALIERFKAKTGCPVLVNTSFNVRSEPIVCTPEDAFRCFMGCGIERLAIGRCYLEKEAQDPALAVSYEQAFTPD